MRRWTPVCVLTAVGLSIGLAATAPARAEQEASQPKLHGRFHVDVGGYWPSVNTALSVDSPGGRNAAVDVENDLGFDDSSTLPFVLMNLRLGERWRLEAEAFQLGRDKTSVINRPITIRDTTFPVNATLSSSFDTAVYRLGIGYSFLKRPRSEAGVAVGLHVTEFELDIRASGGDSAAAADALAPLPMLGFYGYHALSPKWLAFGRADLFSLDYEEYSGSLVNLNLGIEYQLTRSVGLGVGYRYVKLDLDATAKGPVTGGDWVGNFEHSYSGPTLYLSVGF